VDVLFAQTDEEMSERADLGGGEFELPAHGVVGSCDSANVICRVLPFVLAV